MTGRQREMVRALERRRDFLAGRIASYRRDGNPSHDKAEAQAISWALRIIRAADREEILRDLESVAA